MDLKQVVLLSAILLTTGNVKAQNDPCSKTEKLTGSGLTLTSNGIKALDNGYHVELWSELNVGSVKCFDGDADCAFKASWNNSSDFLACVGYYDGSGAKKHTELGRISAEYCYTKQGSGGNHYSYIGVHGWTRNPLMEYYIVDDSFHSGVPYGVTKIASYIIDGEVYNLYRTTRDRCPSIEGTATFPQVFAVRKTKRHCGHVSVTEHFKKWEEAGITLGGLYECKLLCEVGGGHGSIEYTYATMRWKGQPGHGFVPGDVNNDNSITMADANAVVNYFLATDKPADFNVDAADANCDGEVTMADANQIVNIFLGGE